VCWRSSSEWGEAHGFKYKLRKETHEIREEVVGLDLKRAHLRTRSGMRVNELAIWSIE
jgi:hypothetical protein